MVDQSFSDVSQRGFFTSFSTMFDLIGFHDFGHMFGEHRRSSSGRRYISDFEETLDNFLENSFFALRDLTERTRMQDDHRSIDSVPPGCQQYIFQSSYSSNGDNVVEESRESVTEEDGTVHSTTKRRLGDRWCESEVHTDKDGQQTSKDTWYNVPEDQIEAFKTEWDTNHAARSLAFSSAPAIQNSSTE